MTSTTARSAALFDRAQKHIPGGVNSPVRAFRAVGGTPRFISAAAGAHVEDADGNRYVDYVGSWGPMILGHGDPDVVAAIQRQAEIGVSFGAPTELEAEMAEWLCGHVPGMEQVRMVNSGTEATMSAIRLARGATGRNKILKFEGCYHGHGDSLLVKAGSGALTLGVPSSPGVPAEFVAHTLSADYNDLDSVDAAFAEHGDDIACVIVEPVAGNMNCVAPLPGFLEGLRDRCSARGAVLIFDEVMCGFRVHPQGAQGLYGVTADLVTLGKVVGGGLPVGAFGGRADLMAHLAPLGPVYQAGTLSGNPLAMAAGLTTLRKLEDRKRYERVEKTTRHLLEGLQQAADQHGVPFATRQLGSMFGLFFQAQAPDRFSEVMNGNGEAFKLFFHAMLERGIYLAPSAFEAGFVSMVHGEAEVNATVKAAQAAFAQLAQA